MAPLILHNVPEEEQYIGADGIQRPYGVYGAAGTDGNARPVRRIAPETGSFGKSTRRSRSRTGTPAAKREDPTLAAADAIFTQFLAQKSAENVGETQRKSALSASISQPNLTTSGALTQIDGNGGGGPSRSSKEPHKEPTEVILRGFKATQQYSAIREYENIAGRICEDYPRDPPVEQRKFKTDIRDAATMRLKPLTAEEKIKANKFAGGEHWIKVTFESAECAELAVENSPQNIMGHVVFAEMYRGVPPTSDEEILVNAKSRTVRGERFAAQAFTSGSETQTPRKNPSTFSRSVTTPSMREIGRSKKYLSLSPPDSQYSTSTLDTGTIASTATSGTVTGVAQEVQSEQEPLFCTHIPDVRRAVLLPADQALLPQQSFMTRLLASLPLIAWLGVDPIGTQLPTTDQGDFDDKSASLYWRFMFWLQVITGIKFLDWFAGDDE